jgi:hypothetical protein
MGAFSRQQSAISLNRDEWARQLQSSTIGKELPTQMFCRSGLDPCEEKLTAEC